jgi:hypothetical protein
MPNFAVIKDNLVVNTIVAENLAIAEICNPDSICVEFTDNAAIGWLWDGTTFTAPAVPEEK